MDRANNFHWMQISDFHGGLSEAKPRWPQIRQQWFDDIRAHCAKNGPIDLVVFSGDLTNRGLAAEFEYVTSELLRLWDHFGDLGFSPQLFVVPGNHDMVRPGDDSNFRFLVDSCREKKPIKNRLFNKESADSKEVHAWFENYSRFISEIKSKLPLACDVIGVLPGDCAAQIVVNGLSIGLMGLNTAWSQVEDGDYRGRIELFMDQVLPLVDELPDWSQRNNINLLVTHHPSDWFTEQACDEFENEIFLPNYFCAHLFGHMHKNLPEIRIVGGGDAKKTIQASSLFGAEKLAGGSVERTHGYYFACIDAGQSESKLWPRVIVNKDFGGWQIERQGGILKGDSDHITSSWTVKRLEEGSKKRADFRGRELSSGG
ncbi:metallophosphoesterase family protein [Pseudomonas multiresinivorans]|uniref:Calcineurin-like phosphoesterase domain-containing protein n=1 Tax=Pseudomonas multiresinivorans TaxID=95301 RepID=A0A7Z3BJ92_9PSED|nr:metallophosphoesterase [Pseudomonas multiresinivorans]QJP07772.1 hypothetical protein G4G71_07745 [Pseudomonas multiresinivorans]